jgi:hypothetical protein
MNGTETRSDEIERYLDGVRSALADLPDDVRDELLEDLPAHLAEVVSEDPVALEIRLGSPAAYGAELRAAAGLRPGPARWGVPSGLTLSFARLQGWAGRTDRRVGRVIGYRRLTEFLPLLVPAWWVVRGYVLDVLLFGLPTRMSGVVPAVGGNGLLGFVLLLAFLAGSIWLGHRSAGRRPGWQRFGLIGANLVLGVLALVVLGQVSDDIGYARDAATTGPSDNPYSYISDLIPVGPDGRALTGVTLLDQNGNELDLGNPYTCQRTDVDQSGTQEQSPPLYRYPMCLNPDAVIGAARDRLGPAALPGGVISPTAVPATGATPTASPAPTGSPASTASPTRAASASPTASPAPSAGAPVTASPGR